MIFGTGSSPDWEQILTRANVDSLNLTFIPDGQGSSDHTSFYNKRIPVLHYFTDTHADYHRPSDDVEFIEAQGEAKALQHLTRVVQSLDQSSERLTFKTAPVTQRRRMRLGKVTMGVLPDYGFQGKGMRITGVTEGRPAAEAGLKGGDVILKIAETDIVDIYDYMEALGTLKKGQSVNVEIQRDGEDETIEVRF